MAAPPLIVEAANHGSTNPNEPRTPEAIAAALSSATTPNAQGPPPHDPEPYAEAWTDMLAQRT